MKSILLVFAMTMLASSVNSQELFVFNNNYFEYGAEFLDVRTYPDGLVLYALVFDENYEKEPKLIYLDKELEVVKMLSLTDISPFITQSRISDNNYKILSILEDGDVIHTGTRGIPRERNSHDVIIRRSGENEIVWSDTLNADLSIIKRAVVVDSTLQVYSNLPSIGFFYRMQRHHFDIETGELLLDDSPEFNVDTSTVLLSARNNGQHTFRLSNAELGKLENFMIDKINESGDIVNSALFDEFSLGFLHKLSVDPLNDNSVFVLSIIGGNSSERSYGVYRLDAQDLSLVNSGFEITVPHDSLMSVRIINGDLIYLEKFDGAILLNVADIESGESRSVRLEINNLMENYRDVQVPDNGDELILFSTSVDRGLFAEDQIVRIDLSESITSILELKNGESFDFHCFPNPAIPGSLLSIDHDFSGPMNLALRTPTGSLVWFKSVVDAREIESVIIPEIDSGLYFLTLSNTEMHATQLFTLN